MKIRHHIYWQILPHILILRQIVNSHIFVAQFRIFQCICVDFIFKLNVKLLSIIKRWLVSNPIVFLIFYVVIQYDEPFNDYETGHWQCMRIHEEPELYTYFHREYLQAECKDCLHVRYHQLQLSESPYHKPNRTVINVRAWRNLNHTEVDIDDGWAKEMRIRTCMNDC